MFGWQWRQIRCEWRLCQTKGRTTINGFADATGEQFSDYDPPRLRKDGDIVIPLDAVLKKNRAAHQNFAEAFSETRMTGSKRSSTWVK